MSQSARPITYFRQVGTSPLEAWYSPSLCAGNGTGATMANNILTAAPFVISRGSTVDRIGMEVVTGGTASVARIGIYNSTSPINLYPSSLVVDSGEMDTTTAGVKSASISQVLQPGLYWLAHLSSATAAATIRDASLANYYPIFGMTTAMPTQAEVGLTVSQTYGALPSSFTASATTFSDTGTFPVIAVRFST